MTRELDLMLERIPDDWPLLSSPAEEQCEPVWCSLEITTNLSPPLIMESQRALGPRAFFISIYLVLIHLFILYTINRYENYFRNVVTFITDDLIQWIHFLYSYPGDTLELILIETKQNENWVSHKILWWSIHSLCLPCKIKNK